MKNGEEKEEIEFTSVLRMEVGQILGRSEKPPKLDVTSESEVAPFSEKPAWLPLVWRKDKTEDKFELVQPKSPWTALDRALTLTQDRIRAAGNKAVIAMWVNNDLPLAQKDPADSKKRLPPGKNEQHPRGTVAYQVMAANIVGGDEKRGQNVPYISSDVVAATARKIDRLCATLWKRPIPVVPSFDDRWPVWFRPSGWRFVSKDGRNIAFNFDGTWWRVALRLPRKKGRKRPADPYVMATLKRIVAAEDARGIPHEKAIATADRWVPSTLGLQKKAGKWFALISYRQPKRPQIEVPNVMVVHCGLRVFAVANDLQGMLTRRRAEWIHGSPLLARKFRFRKQRQKLQREVRKYAVHGRGHAHQGIDLIDDKERAFVDDWLRRRAVRIVNLAKERGAKIFIMSMENIRKRKERSDLPEGIRIAVHQAPWFKFRAFIEQDAKKLGVPTETYTPWWHTQRCPNPKCGMRSAAFPHYDRTWLFHCTACGYEQNIEIVALQNAFWDLAREDRIKLPAGVDVTAIFDAMDKEAKEAAEARRARREQAHFTPLGAERFGGETFSGKVKRGVGGGDDRRKDSRSRTEEKGAGNTRLSSRAMRVDAETRKR